MGYEMCNDIYLTHITKPLTTCKVLVRHKVCAYGCTVVYTSIHVTVEEWATVACCVSSAESSSSVKTLRSTGCRSQKYMYVYDHPFCCNACMYIYIGTHTGSCCQDHNH